MRCWGVLLGLSLMLGQAGAAMAPAGTNMQVQAVATYTTPGASVIETVRSNILVLQIAAVEDFSLQGDSWLARSPGSQVSIPYRLSNLGNTLLELGHVVVNSNTCVGNNDSHDLANMRVVVDSNGNGMADAGELGNNDRVSLTPGMSASVLVVGDLPLGPGSGACIQLKAVSANQNRLVNSFVSMADNPVVLLDKQVSALAPLKPGGSDVAAFTITARNTGSRDALSSTTAAGGQSITIDGGQASVLLLRDEIPAGAMFRMGSVRLQMV